MIPPTYSPLFTLSFIWVAMGAITASGLTIADNEVEQPINPWTFLLCFFFWPLFLFVYFFVTLLITVHKAAEAFRLVMIQKSYGKTSFWAILKDLSRNKK